MARVDLPPEVRCDNCGKTEEMIHPFEKWIRPRTWSGVKCDSISGDEYPNNIAMPDLCPECGKAVHSAIKDALIRAQEEANRMIETLKKADRNELRDWPDWRTADPNKAIEHHRGKHD